MAVIPVAVAGLAAYNARPFGAIAQLGERLHGMQEVGGSIPPSSTIFRSASPSSRGLGHRPFTAVTGVRIPLGTPLMLRDLWRACVGHFNPPRVSSEFSRSTSFTYPC